MVRIHLKRLYGQDPLFDVNDFLGRWPTLCNLSHDRRFWKMLASFVVVCLKPHNLTGERLRSNKGSLVELFEITCADRRLMGLRVSTDIIQEYYGLIKVTACDIEALKLIASWSNIKSFINNGIFGNQFVMRCPRGQIQLAAYHLIMTFCAVHPSEFLDGWLKKSALQYCNLNFYLFLWTEEEDNILDFTKLAGSSHTGSTSRSAFQLHCDVHFGHLKGHCHRNIKWRDKPLYSHS